MLVGHGLSFKMSKNVETQFIVLFLHHNKGAKLVRPTSEQDQKEHWDCEFNGIKYDVKSRKKVQRHDKYYTEDVIVELRNVHGNAGWARGKADYIAQERETDFLLIPRQDLLQLALKKLTMDKGNGYYQQYTRAYRNDLVTLVPIADVLTLPCKTILKSMN